MKYLTILFLFLLAQNHSLGQAITNYNLSNEGNNTLKIGSTFDSNGAGPVVQDNSSVSIFVPVGLTTPVITNLQGGNWSATIIANSVLESACGAAADGYYLMQVSTSGQANLGSVDQGVPEDLFTASFSGSESQPVFGFDPAGGDPLSACVATLGVDNTASIDPDGNAGPAPTVGYSNLDITPNSIVLPIELILFNAQPVNERDALLDWKTATELNSSYFGVERRTTDSEWEKIATVAAAGTSTQELDYRLIDKHVFDPSNMHDDIFYYRLKMFDLDGGFEYSEVRQVSFKTQNGLLIGELFPNPASRHSVLIQLPVYSEQRAELYLTIYDMQGRVISGYQPAIEPGNQMVPIKRAPLATGVYLAKIEVEQHVYVRKLVVQ